MSTSSASANTRTSLSTTNITLPKTRISGNSKDLDTQSNKESEETHLIGIRKISHFSSTSTPLPGVQSPGVTSPAMKSGNASVPLKKNSNSGPSNVGFNSPIPCGESFFEEDAKLTQSHVNFMTSFNRKPTEFPSSTSITHSRLSTGSPESSSHVWNLQRNSSASLGAPPQPVFNKFASNSSAMCNTNLTENTSSTSMSNLPETSNFSFDYKISSDSGVIATQSTSYRERSLQQNVSEEEDFIDQCPEELFMDEDDFNEDFTEEVQPYKTAKSDLPTITPRRQNKSYANG